MFHVLVIEDQADSAHFLCKGLREAGYQVELCTDSVSGHARALQQPWDLLVIDRMLEGDADGLDIVTAVRAQGLTTPMLILSALASLDERVRGLRAGGDDYLTKPFAFAELQARIEALLRRSADSSPVRELRVADLTLDLVSRRAQRGGQPILLQPREFRLLEFLVRNQGQLVTRTMLLEGVWDYHFDPRTNVIDVQISRLRTKIDKGFSTPLLHTVRGLGYMLDVRE